MISACTGWVLKIWIINPIKKDIEHILDFFPKIDKSLDTANEMNSQSAMRIAKLETRCDGLDREIHDLKKRV